MDCDADYLSGGYILPTMVCADSSEGGKGPCTGDYGSPLFDTNNSTLVGMWSWGNGCAVDGFPSVYTRVSSYIDWINYNLVWLGSQHLNLTAEFNKKHSFVPQSRSYWNYLLHEQTKLTWRMLLAFKKYWSTLTIISIHLVWHWYFQLQFEFWFDPVRINRVWW